MKTLENITPLLMMVIMYIVVTLRFLRLVEDMESRFNTLYVFWIFIVMVGKARKIS